MPTLQLDYLREICRDVGSCTAVGTATSADSGISYQAWVAARHASLACMTDSRCRDELPLLHQPCQAASPFLPLTNKGAPRLPLNITIAH